MKYCVLIVLVASVGFCLSTEDYKSQWELFKTKYHKTYKNETEEAHRYDVFSGNMQKIEEHNKLYESGKSHFKMGVNNFTDMTRNEFKKFLEEQGGHIHRVYKTVEEEWKDFKVKYHKTYSTPEEEKYRFKIFSETLAEVKKHNDLFTRGQSSYKMAINQFSDLTKEERRQYNKTWPLPKADYRKEFEDFKKKFNKVYKNEQEEEYRFEIFSEALDEVRKHNALFEKGLSSYKKGINQFSDLTEEERRQYNKTWPLPKADYRKEFENFKKTFNKTYASKEEEQYRFEIFSESLDEVRKHNALFEKGQSSFKMGINKFSDLTEEERRQYNKTWPLPRADYRKEFENFKKTFNKTYASKEEEQYRFEIFSESLDEVRKHNALFEKGQSSYKMAINKFSDLTEEERRQYNKTWPLPNADYQKEFEDFKHKFNKSYPNEKEEKFRFQIFCKTLDEVIKHNVLYEKGLSKFKMGINKFADLTAEERRRYLGNQSKVNYQKEWENFKQKYNRTYSTKEEEEYRFEIFSNSLDEVQKHNELFEKGLSSYKIGINQFSDMTEEERRQYNKTWPLPHADYQKEFEDFKHKFNRTYPDEKEEKFRFQIFCKTLDEVIKHNVLYEKGLSKFKMGINKFADLTAEERRRYLDNHSKVNYQKEWENFKQKYNRTYSTKEEEEYRFELFSNSLDEVQKHNELFEKGLSSYKIGINQFSDMTEEERRQYNKTWPIHHDDDKKEFEDFKVKFNRTYATPEEEQFRFKIFVNTLNEVRKHNELYEKGQTTFRMEINKFADMTAEERRKYTMTFMSTFIPILPEHVYEEEWAKFTKTYQRLYESEKEESMRYKIFRHNLDEITLNNKLYDMGLRTSTMGVNKFADYTPEEFHKLLGVIRED